MLKDGPVKPTSSAGSNERATNGRPSKGPSLADRLALKASKERATVETLTQSELRRLGESSRIACENELSSIESAIHARSQKITDRMDRIERRQRLGPLWTGLGTIVTVLCGLLVLWGASAWTNRSLAQARGELNATRAAIMSERNALNALQQQTGGVRIERHSNGTFVVLPVGTDVRTNWNCTETGDEPCFRVAPPVPIGRPPS